MQRFLTTMELAKQFAFWPLNWKCWWECTQKPSKWIYFSVIVSTAITSYESVYEITHIVLWNVKCPNWRGNLGLRRFQINYLIRKSPNILRWPFLRGNASARRQRSILANRRLRKIVKCQECPESVSLPDRTFTLTGCVRTSPANARVASQ